MYVHTFLMGIATWCTSFGRRPATTYSLMFCVAPCYKQNNKKDASQRYADGDTFYIRLMLIFFTVRSWCIEICKYQRKKGKWSYTSIFSHNIMCTWWIKQRHIYISCNTKFYNFELPCLRVKILIFHQRFFMEVLLERQANIMTTWVFRKKEYWHEKKARFTIILIIWSFVDLPVGSLLYLCIDLISQINTLEEIKHILSWSLLNR